MHVSQIPEISFSDLEKNPDSGPVWVVNSTKDKNRGSVLLTVSRLQGMGVDTVNVPSTIHPVDLSTHVSRKQLLSDNQFRRAVAIKVLKLVCPEAVSKYYESNPRARTELDKVYNGLSANGLRQQAAGVSDVEVVSDDILPPPVKNWLDLVQYAKTNGTLDAEEEDLETRLENLGEQKEETLHHLAERLNGLSTYLRKSVRAMIR